MHEKKKKKLSQWKETTCLSKEDSQYWCDSLNQLLDYFLLKKKNIQKLVKKVTLAIWDNFNLDKIVGYVIYRLE